MSFHFRWAKLSLGELRFNTQQSNPFLDNSYRPSLCFHFLMKITEVIVTHIELWIILEKKKRKGKFGSSKKWSRAILLFRNNFHNLSRSGKLDSQQLKGCFNQNSNSDPVLLNTTVFFFSFLFLLSRGEKTTKSIRGPIPIN